MRALASILIVFAAACGHDSTPAKNVTSATTAAAAPGAFQPTSFRVAVSGSGRPVIFIPGLTCDGHVWDETISHVAAHLGGKVQAHVLSLAGFAGTPPIKQELLPLVRDEIIQYIRANHLEHPILVGHSLGGFMTYWVAETAPDLIAGGVAVDGAPFMPALLNPAATVENSATMAGMMRQHMSGAPEQFQSDVRNFFAGMMREPAKHQALIDAAARSDQKTSADAMYALMQTDLRPDLTKITAPIMAIAADGDGQGHTSADDVAKAWHAQIDLIAQHEVVMIEHSRHFVMQDQPDAFYAALDRFLAAH